MKVALTVWGNRISPVFDSAQTVLLAELLDRKIVNKKLEFIALLIPVSIARKIVGFKPDSLICGAISEQPARIIEDAGITLIPFISGKAELILQAYAQNLEINKYCMPGCSTVRRCSNMVMAGNQSALTGLENKAGGRTCQVPTGTRSQDVDRDDLRGNKDV